MTLLAPAVLAGLGALAVPVAIHLLNKSRAKPMRWAAMQFLVEAARQNQRRVELQDLLLLLLRCLLVALLVLAFAQPFLTGPAGVGGLTGAVVVVVDRGASMGYSDGVETRVQGAIRAADELVRRLPTDVPAGLVLAGPHPDAIILPPSTDRALLRKRLESVEPAALPSDLAAALVAAAEGLDEGGTIHVFSDFTRTSVGAAEVLIAALGRFPEVRVEPHPVGAGETANFGLTAISAEGSPTMGFAWKVLVTVTNFGGQAASPGRMTVRVGDQPPQDEVEVPVVPPGASVQVPLKVTFAAPGPQGVTASLPGDALAVDNEASLAADVAVARRVLLVMPDGTGPDPATFFAHALLPFSAEERVTAAVQVERAGELPAAPGDLERFALVIVEAQVLSEAGIRVLLDYVREGGGGLVIGGHHATEFLTPLGFAVEGELAGPASLQSSRYEHPVTDLWNDGRNGHLGAVRLEDFQPLADGPSVLLRAAGGEIVAAERTLGAGRLAVFAFDPTPPGSLLALHPGFVALVQRLADFMVRGGMVPPATPGSIVQLPLPPDLFGRDLEWIGPGRAGRRSLGRAERDGERVFVQFRDTARPGAYLVFPKDEPEPVAAFVVQTPARTGDLSALPAAETVGLFAGFGGSGPEADAPGPGGRVPTASLWSWVLLLAVLVWLAEFGLSTHLTRAR